MILRQFLPPSLIASFLWPAVAVFALCRSLGSAGRSWQSMFAAAYGRPPGLLLTWRNFIDKAYVRLALLSADRFHEPAWQSRFTVTGLEALSACLAAGCPVVLAVIHTHHVNVLRLFLRTRGLPVASLVNDHGHPADGNVTAERHAPGSSPVPPGKFPLAHLRSAYAFLRSGHCLLVACDVPTEEAVTVSTQLGTLRVHVGPFRLAALANARVVPAISRQDGPWRFHLAFGAPVCPPAHASGLSAFEPLAAHCLATWQAVLQNHLEQHNVRRGVWNVPPGTSTRSAGR